jgi:hypothetical protein
MDGGKRFVTHGQVTTADGRVLSWTEDYAGKASSHAPGPKGRVGTPREGAVPPRAASPLSRTACIATPRWMFIYISRESGTRDQ